MRKSALLASLAVMLPLVAHADRSPDELATMLFMGVCVPSQGHEEPVAAAAEKMHLAPLTKDQAGALSLTAAWATADGDGQFLLGMAGDTCSVMVRDVDTAALQASIESWLPPPSSPFTYKKQNTSSADGALVTTYALYKAGQPFASWVVMTSNDPKVKHHGVLSVKPAPVQ